MVSQHSKIYTERFGTDPSISTILFDFDDTLADSFPAMVYALQSAFSDHGMSKIDASEFLLDTKGQQLTLALNELIGDLEKSTNLLDSYRLHYWQQNHINIKLFPQVDTMLRSLSQKTIKMGVITQKVREFVIGNIQGGVTRELSQLGILELFHVVIGYEDVTAYKPDPQGINLALGRLRSVPEKTLVIGDSTADIAAANASGCWSCLATWSQRIHVHRVHHTTPHFVFSSPADVLQFLGHATIQEPQ